MILLSTMNSSFPHIKVTVPNVSKFYLHILYLVIIGMICFKFLIPHYHIKTKIELSLQLTKSLCSYRLIYISFPKHKTEHLPDLHRFTYVYVESCYNK